MHIHELAALHTVILGCYKHNTTQTNQIMYTPLLQAQLNIPACCWVAVENLAQFRLSGTVTLSNISLLKEILVLRLFCDKIDTFTVNHFNSSFYILPPILPTHHCLSCHPNVVILKSAFCDGRGWKETHYILSCIWNVQCFFLFTKKGRPYTQNQICLYRHHESVVSVWACVLV
jgi:hypothetical protein